MKQGSYQAANVASMMRQRMADAEETSPELALRQIVDYLQGNPESFVPLLGLLSLKGKRFTLKDHFPMEPVFKCQLPTRQLMKCGRQVSKCMAVTSSIKLANGQSVKASEIRIGDEVVSLRGDNWVVNKVSKIFKTGIKELLEVTTSSGGKVRITPEHRLATLYHGYLPAGQLRKDGDFLACHKNNQLSWTRIESVEKVGTGETVDFEVLPNHNFVLDGIVSHNSMSLAADGVLRAATTPFLQTLYVTPRFEQIRRLSTNYVRPLIRNSILYPLMVDESCVQQVLQRSFINESTMFFSFCFLEVDRLRGVSADNIKLDEVQDLDYDFIPVIMECKSHSVLGLTSYSGTPKTIDNTIEALWQLSSQAEWVVPCFSCGHWNMACVAADLNKMIGKETVVCGKCQKPINPSQGHWYHTAAKDHGDFPGYHVPQPIMPLHYASSQKWRELLVKQQTYSSQKFLNEVLGESCDMGVKLITLTDIKNASILGPNDYYKAAQLFKNCELRVLAVDWGGGGAEETSFTVASLIGWNPYEAKVQCHYTVRMNAGYTHQDEAAFLLKLFTETSCHIFAHDYGGSGAIRETLMIQAGLPMTRIMNLSYVRATAKNIMYYNAPVAQGSSRGYYALDKARSLVLQATCLKSGLLQLPEYESAKDVTRDLLALMEDKHEMPGGSDVYLIRRQPKLSDDFAHSLNFGCVAIWHSKQNWPDLAAINQFKLSDDAIRQLEPPSTER